MSEKEMTLAETRGVVEPDGVREIRELVGKAGRWTQYTIDVLLDYIDTLTAALAEARREREAWKERYLKEAANHDTTRSAWGKEEANMIREARALFAEVERLRAKVETARKIAKDYWESADEVAETVASDILEALDAE